MDESVELTWPPAARGSWLRSRQGDPSDADLDPVRARTFRAAFGVPIAERPSRSAASSRVGTARPGRRRSTARGTQPVTAQSVKASLRPAPRPRSPGGVMPTNSRRPTIASASGNPAWTGAGNAGPASSPTALPTPNRATSHYGPPARARIAGWRLAATKLGSRIYRARATQAQTSRAVGSPGRRVVGSSAVSMRIVPATRRESSSKAASRGRGRCGGVLRQ